MKTWKMSDWLWTGIILGAILLLVRGVQMMSHLEVSNWEIAGALVCAILTFKLLDLLARFIKR